MRRCLGCESRFDGGDKCPSCGAVPDRVGGFEAYAPEFLREGVGFEASYFTGLAEYEASSFWFVARNEILLWALERHARGFGSMLEVGCGTGFVLSGIARAFPAARLCGSEIFPEGLKFAAQRAPGVRLMQMDARRIPFVDEFDVVGAFDVLEHIAEDGAVLRQMHQALKRGGVLLLTVPQHPWLWSAADEFAHHERRYEAKDLHARLVDAGFRVERSTSFVTSLLPAMMLSRRRTARGSGKCDPRGEFRIHPMLNTMFLWALRAELAGMRLGLDYPVGGSRLVVARKAG